MKSRPRLSVEDLESSVTGWELPTGRMRKIRRVRPRTGEGFDEERTRVERGRWSASDEAE